MYLSQLQLAVDDRYLQKDPEGFSGGDTNLYGYVMNDPVNFVDPLGLYQASPTDGTGGNNSGYVDVNVTIGFGPGVTGGVLYVPSTGQVLPYVGGAVTTPPGGVSVMYSPQTASSGWNVGGQGGYGVGAGAGYGFGSGAYGEAGFTTPGASASGYYVFPPINGCGSK